MKKRILIIEDDKELRENIYTLLDEEGYDVLACSDAETGYITAQQNKVDLIISDIMLPGLSGYELLEKLNKSGTTTKVPFIFLSAKAERHDLRLGMELGADDYIFKPFKSENLLNSIKTRLKRFEKIKQFANHEKNNNRGNIVYSLDDRLFIDSKTKANFIKVGDIKYISADNQYSVVHLNNMTEFLFRRSLNNWENILPENSFIRIHRSTIINLEHVTKIEKSLNNKHRVILNKIETPLEVSKRYIAKIRSKNK